MPPPIQPRPAQFPSRMAEHGFTLIELLTVITIIGILAGILIPVVGKVRNSAYDVQCKTSLRQWGIAISGYVTDNRGLLPGPAGGDVYMRNGHLKDGAQGLFSFLAPYVTMKNTDTGRLPDDYVCRNNRHMAVDTLQSPVYHAHTNVLGADGTYSGNIAPMGKYGKKGQAAKQPLNYNSLHNLVDLSRGKALEDADISLSYLGDQASLPQQIVHGDHHNILYYDWHVGTEKVTLPAP